MRSTALPLRYLRVAALLLSVGVIGGCQTDRKAEKPVMNAGEGGISGQLVNEYGEAFDLKGSGINDPHSIRIDLISQASGVVAATYPKKQESRFIFSHVNPGHYELSVYWYEPGKRAVAGNMPVDVNANQVTPVKFQLTDSGAGGPK